MSLRLYYTDIQGICVDRLNEFYDKYRPRFVYVMFSAGKDSTCVL